MHAFEFLAQTGPLTDMGLWAIHGDDRWLRKTAMQALQRRVLGDDDSVGPVKFGEGPFDWADVADSLSSVSLFGPPISLVIVEDADKFVTQCRGKIEQWAGRPAGRAALVLDVASWPGNTNLAKLTAAQGHSILCSLPRTKGANGGLDFKSIVSWLQHRAKTVHEFSISQDAARHLIDNSLPELGLWDQQLSKLALYAMDGRKVDAELIDEVIGGWGQKDSFAMINLALDGQAAAAVRVLERLLQGGEIPQAMFGAMAWTLRRYAAAIRNLELEERGGSRGNLPGALSQAGFYGGQLNSAQERIKHLGRKRCREMYQRLLEFDLKLKGSHSTPDRVRWLFETTLIELSQPAVKPRRAGT